MKTRMRTTALGLLVILLVPTLILCVFGDRDFAQPPADTQYCYAITTNSVDNAGWYDSCMGWAQGNCAGSPGCQVYSGISVPGSYCGFCTGEGCSCTGVPVKCNSAPGGCVVGGVNPCWCKYSNEFPPPPLPPATVNNCTSP